MSRLISRASRLSFDPAVRFTLVRAPPGFGKTSLSMEWAPALRAMRVDLEYLAVSAQSTGTVILDSINRALGTRLTEATESGARHRRTNAHSAANRRSAASTQRQPSDQVLIFLDSCEHIAPDASFWEQLHSLLQASPASVRWVFASNAPLPLDKLELIRLGTVRELSARDLELAATDVVALTAGHARMWSRESIEELGGWPALIALASSGDSPRSPSGLRRDVENYVLAVARQMMSEAELTFLIELTCLAEIPVRLANFVLECDDAFDRLRGIEARTALLRVSGTSPDSAVFSMLQPVRRALALEFERRGETRGRHLRRRASMWHMQMDQPDKAIEQLLACGDFDEASSAIEKLGLEYSFRFGIAHHEQALLRLPATLRDSLPRVRLAWIHVMARSGKTEASRIAFDQLRHATSDFWCDREGSVPGKLYTEAKLVELTIAAWCGTIVSLEQLHATDVFFRSSSRFTLLELRYASRFLTAICFQRGDFVRAQSYNQKAHEIDSNESLWIREFWPEMYSALLCVERCRIDEAVAHLDAARGALETADRDGTTEATWYGAARAELDYEQNRLGTADGAVPIADNFERALHSATVTGGVFDVWAAGYLTLASARYCSGGLERSLEVLLKAQEFSDQRGLRSLSMVLVAHRVRILFRAGLAAAAIKESQRAGLLTRLAGYPNANDLTWREYTELVLATARCELELERWDRASEILMPAIANATALGGSRSEAKFRLLAAVCETGTGRPKQAGEHLAVALGLLVQQRLLRPIIDEGKIVSVLLGRVIARPEDFACSKATVEMAKIAARWCSHDAQSPVGDLLTTREMQVLRMLAQGGSNKAIAKSLTVSEHAVKFHLKRIYSKLGVRSRDEAVAEARERQLYRIRDSRTS